MYKNILKILTIGFLILSSCKNAEVKSKFQLKGKIYSSSLGMDSINCETIIKATDYFESLIFIDDTVFIQAFYSCCPEPEEDFLSETYCSGIYKLDKQFLTLFYSHKIVQVIIIGNSTQSTDSLVVPTTRFVIEDVKLDKLTYPRYSCNNIPYFKNTYTNPFEFLTPDNTAKGTYISDLKSSGIWERLFKDKEGLLK